MDNPNSRIGCYAISAEDYHKFSPYFTKIIAECNNVPENAKHESNWDLNSIEGLSSKGLLDLRNLGFIEEITIRVRVCRNLTDFPFSASMSKQDRINLEKKMTLIFDKLLGIEEFGGEYHSLTPGHKNYINRKKYLDLQKENLIFNDITLNPNYRSSGIANDWPYGRGSYISKNKQFLIWVGGEDHLKIISLKKGFILNQVFNNLKIGLDILNNTEGLKFQTNPEFGVITSCPSNLGTAMRASVIIAIPRLTTNATNIIKAKEICRSIGLSLRGSSGANSRIGPGGICDISPLARYSITEAQIITSLYNGIKILKEAEDAFPPVK